MFFKYQQKKQKNKYCNQIQMTKTNTKENKTRTFRKKKSLNPHYNTIT